MKHGSLFSGIGGFDLAAEWMGWENVFHCEINPFGRKVLKYYWPKAISYNDITKQTLPHIGEQLTFFQEDSLANLTALQEKERVQKMIGISGRKCLEQLGRFNQVGSWGKTFLELLVGTGDWYSKKCKLTWKMRATKYRRFYFQLVPSKVGIEETGFGLLLTPSTVQIAPTEGRRDKRKAYRASVGRQDTPGSLLEQIIHFIPTIGANEPKGASRKRYRNSEEYRGAKTAEYMRTSKEDHIYLHPSFAEAMMGFPQGWTELPLTAMQ